MRRPRPIRVCLAGGRGCARSPGKVGNGVAARILPARPPLQGADGCGQGAQVSGGGSSGGGHRWGPGKGNPVPVGWPWSLLPRSPCKHLPSCRVGAPPPRCPAGQRAAVPARPGPLRRTDCSRAISCPPCTGEGSLPLAFLHDLQLHPSFLLIPFSCIQHNPTPPPPQIKIDELRRLGDSI